MKYTYDEARAAGYLIAPPDHPSAKLKALCKRLGDDYHLATIDNGNVVHRVIGDGWDVEIFPANKAQTLFNITVYSRYGYRNMVNEYDVKPEAVAGMVEMLLRLYVPEEVYPGS